MTDPTTKAVWKTDWLNTKPVYYNTKTGQVSHRCFDVIDWKNVSFHPEGLYNYLTYGYNLFQQTPIQDVKFLRHLSTLTLSTDPIGKYLLTIEEHDDPCLEAINTTDSSVDKVLGLLKNHVSTFEKNADPAKRFLLPLSGGYDSRMLAHLISDKSRIDAFTYSITRPGTKCPEVVRAKEVAKRMNLNWTELFLSQFTSPEIIRKDMSLFGPTIPVHAAYHIDLYEHIQKNFGKNYIALSGSVGDWWAGQKVALGDISTLQDFKNVFFNHGICGHPGSILISPKLSDSERVFEQNKPHFKDQKFKRLFMGRNRIALASYIYRTAEHYFEAYTPYYDFEIAMTMLNLPQKDAYKRQWLHEYYKNQGLDVSHLRGNAPNEQDILAARAALDVTDFIRADLVSEFYAKDRVKWINETLWDLKTRRSLRFMSHKRRLEYFQAYNEWTVLKPLEMIARLREATKETTT